MKFNNVSKNFGNLNVLKNFSCDLSDNETHIVMGASGCGKTTFLRLLLDLEQPDEGTINGLDGKSMAAVFQENRLCENLSVLTNILLPHTKKDTISRNKIASEVTVMLEKVGLLNLESQKVTELSGGMKRRVALLRAVMADCDTVVFDEPLKGLDIETKKHTMEALAPRLKGKTVIWITHDKSDCNYFKNCRIWNLTSTGLRGGLAQ